MEFIKANSYEELSKIASDIIIKQLKEKTNSVLGLATGSTPLGTYKNLINAYKDNKISFKDVTTINLDEYLNLAPENPCSYRYFMNENLFNHIDINKENTFVPDGLNKNCIEFYKNLIKNNPIDLQILGLGLDGHIGFNEPADKFSEYTHIANLDKSTIEANSRFFKSIDDVPTKAITMGIKEIMSAKKIILLVNSINKKEILIKSMFENITPFIPASILQQHSNTTIVYCD